MRTPGGILGTAGARAGGREQGGDQTDEGLRQKPCRRGWEGAPARAGTYIYARHHPMASFPFPAHHFPLLLSPPPAVAFSGLHSQIRSISQSPDAPSNILPSHPAPVFSRPYLPHRPFPGPTVHPRLPLLPRRRVLPLLPPRPIRPPIAISFRRDACRHKSAWGEPVSQANQPRSVWVNAYRLVHDHSPYFDPSPPSSVVGRHYDSLSVHPFAPIHLGSRTFCHPSIDVTSVLAWQTGSPISTVEVLPCTSFFHR